VEIIRRHGGPHTMENARRKAYTARSFRTSTAAYAKRFADNDPVVRQQVTLPNVIAIPGGLPIRVGDDVIGGAAVSGSLTSPVSRPGSTKICGSAQMSRSGGRRVCADQATPLRSNQSSMRFSVFCCGLPIGG
jgi:hypothetical protein